MLDRNEFCRWAERLSDDMGKIMKPVLEEKGEPTTEQAL